MVMNSLKLAAGVLCCIVGILIYLNTLECGIVYDDEPAIRKNKDLRPETPWSGLLYHDFWGSEMTSKSSHKSYRPLCVATFRLNYMLHELQPMGYHLVNVLLHGVVCYLYVQLCGVIFSEVWPALIAGLLFAVHPIHTEAVAGLVGRTELLSGIFFITALLSFRHAAMQERKGGVWMALCLLSCLCSVLGKEQGITVVAVCVTYDLFIVHQMNLYSCVKILYHITTDRKQLPQWFTSFLCRFLLLAAFTISFLVLRVQLMKGGPNIFHININPPMFMETPYRQLSWLYLLFFNSWLMFNPIKLCPDWRFGTVPLIRSIFDPHNVLTIATVAVVTLLSVCAICGKSKNTRTLLIGLAMMIFPFIPASNLFFPVGFVVAERVLYLPSMGFCLLVGYGVWCLYSHFHHFLPRTLIKLIYFVLIILLAGRVILRNKDWVSNVTLYSSGVRCNPNHGVMLTNLGIEHGRLRNFSFAERLYQQSIISSPTHSRGFANYGGLLEALKRYDEAEAAFRKSIVLGLNDSAADKVIETYVFLIDKIILRNSSRLQEALDLCEQATMTYPTYVTLYGLKGRLLFQLNRTKEAIENLELVAETPLQEPEMFYYLALAYLKVGKKEDAEIMFRNTLAVDSSHRKAAGQLGMMIQAMGGAQNNRRLLEAEKLLRFAIARVPPNTVLEEIHALGLVYFDLQNYQKAKELLTMVVSASPKDTEAMYHLARVMAKLRDNHAATVLLEKLLKLKPSYVEAKKLLDYITS